MHSPIKAKWHVNTSNYIMFAQSVYSLHISLCISHCIFIHVLDISMSIYILLFGKGPRSLCQFHPFGAIAFQAQRWWTDPQKTGGSAASRDKGCPTWSCSCCWSPCPRLCRWCRKPRKDTKGVVRSGKPDLFWSKHGEHRNRYRKYTGLKWFANPGINNKSLVKSHGCSDADDYGHDGGMSLRRP